MFFIFQETELSYISEKHIQNQKHIQNLDLFRTRDIFRTLTNICDGKFCKKKKKKLLSALSYFLAFPSSKSKKNPLLKNFLYSRKSNFLTPGLKNFLYSRRRLSMPKNQKFLIFLFKHKRKRKKFLTLFLIKKQNFLNQNTFLKSVFSHSIIFFSILNQFIFFIF